MCCTLHSLQQEWSCHQWQCPEDDLVEDRMKNLEGWHCVYLMRMSGWAKRRNVAEPPDFTDGCLHIGKLGLVLHSHHVPWYWAEAGMNLQACFRSYSTVQDLDYLLLYIWVPDEDSNRVQEGLGGGLWSSNKEVNTNAKMVLWLGDKIFLAWRNLPDKLLLGVDLSCIVLRLYEKHINEISWVIFI